MLETASTLAFFSSFSLTVFTIGAAAAFSWVALVLLALKEVSAKKVVIRHTMDVGKKIFFTNLGFFEVIGKRCGGENIMRNHQFQTFLSIFSTAGQIYEEVLVYHGFLR